MEEVGIHRAVDGYLAGLEPRTASAYRGRVSDWLKWCGENGLDPLGVERRHIEAYGRWLRERLGRSKNTVASALSVVCGLYGYACGEGLLDEDPGIGVRRPRVAGHSGGTYLDRGQATRFLAAADGAGALECALCRLLLVSGLRVSEAIGLDVPDLSLGDSPTARLRRKGDWRHEVALAGSTADALRALVGGRESGPVFRRRGRRLDYQAARSIVSGLAESVGAEGITPHSLRRSFCTLARDAGVDDRDIMALGGWSSVQMLDYYDMGRRSARPGAPDRIDPFISGA